MEYRLQSMYNIWWGAGRVDSLIPYIQYSLSDSYSNLFHDVTENEEAKMFFLMLDRVLT